MRTVPILAGGILLVLAFGTATAVAATNDSTRAEAVRVTVDAAPEPTVAAEPVVVVAPVEATEPELAWLAPTAQPAPEPTELQLAPGYEVPTFDETGAGDMGEPAPVDWSLNPAYVPAHCSDVMPQSAIDALYPERGFTLYGIHFPVDWYFPWQGYPADELQLMQEHWLANCTWYDNVNSTATGWHVDFGAGLDAAELVMLQQQSASWQSTTLSTGDVLLVDTASSDQQFALTRAYVLQGDRWMRLIVTTSSDVGTDPLAETIACAETLLASGLTWP